MSKPEWQWPPDASRVGLGNAEAQWGQDKTGELAMREAIQNSMDAARERTQCKVHVERIQRRWQDLPDGVGLRAAIQERVDVAKESGNDSRGEELRQIEEALSPDEIELLLIHDNGHGVTENEAEALVGEGAGTKSTNIGQRGSFGMGHLALNGGSAIRTTIYASNHKKEGAILAGQCIMSTGRRTKNAENWGAKGFLQMGVLTEDDRFHDFALGTDADPWTTDMQKRRSTVGLGKVGTTIAILAPQIVSDAEDLSNLLTIIAANFTVAVYDDKLVVTTSSKAKKLNQSTLGRWLNRNPGGTKIRHEDRMNLLQTLENGTEYEYPVKVAEGKTEMLRLWLETGLNDPHSTIDIVREGMLITRVKTQTKFPYIRTNDRNLIDLETYRLVWNIESRLCDTIAEAVRQGEEPSHDEVKADRMNPANRNVVRAATQAIKDFLQENVKKYRPSDEPFLPILEVETDKEDSGDTLAELCATSTWRAGGTPPTTARVPGPGGRRKGPRKPKGGRKGSTIGKRYEADAVVSCETTGRHAAMISLQRPDAKANATFEIEMAIDDGQRELGDSKPPWGLGEHEIVDASVNGTPLSKGQQDNGNWRVDIPKDESTIEVRVRLNPDGPGSANWRARCMEVK